MNARFLATAIAALPLAACHVPDEEFGSAIRLNNSHQIVDERPVYAGVPQEGSESVRLVAAQRRYLKGSVKELLKVDGKSTIGGQGGASGDAAASSGGSRTSAAP